MPTAQELLAQSAAASSTIQQKAKDNPSELLAKLGAGVDDVKQTLLKATDGPEELKKSLDIISPSGLGTLTGKASKLWKPFEAELAAKLDDLGSSAETIWKNTGTYKGPIDGLMRQEVSDVEAALKPFKGKGNGTVRLGDMLEHKKLFEAYPELADIPVGPGKGFAFGKTADGGVAMSVDPHMLKKQPEKFLNILLHEVQHGIQNIEGFAKGGTPQGATQTAAYRKLTEGLDISRLGSTEPGKRLLERLSNNVYRKIGGEAEARAVQARHYLDPEDARNMLPTNLGPGGYDVGLDQLIKAPK